MCNRRDLGYVEKVKDSFEPDLNQRPKDIKYASRRRSRIFEMGVGAPFVII